mmetsp:Transcript_6726/g.19208  ORF Transcript_6726/g.19208 Transcript_6726/m.19208 type:complete len:229 (+) Transcript_6726:1959-2645(+)
MRTHETSRSARSSRSGGSSRCGRCGRSGGFAPSFRRAHRARRTGPSTSRGGTCRPSPCTMRRRPATAACLPATLCGGARTCLRQAVASPGRSPKLPTSRSARCALCGLRARHEQTGAEPTARRGFPNPSTARARAACAPHRRPPCAGARSAIDLCPHHVWKICETMMRTSRTSRSVRFSRRGPGVCGQGATNRRCQTSHSARSPCATRGQNSRGPVATNRRTTARRSR